MNKMIKQTWAQVKSQPLMSLVSVTGTALAIFLIMVVVMVQQVDVVPFAPESGRDRFLHYKYLSQTHERWGDNSSNGPMSMKVAKAVFHGLETPEAVAVYGCYPATVPVSVPGQKPMQAEMMGTDAGFWRVFDFDFLSGNPYGQEMVDAGEPVVVLSRSVARKLFGDTDALGRDIMLNHVSYRVCGVVKDVSTLASTAYAQMWVPYTSSNLWAEQWNDDMGGMYSVTILAKSRDDFPAIRQELAGKFADFEQASSGWKFIHRGRPYEQSVEAIAFAANLAPAVKEHRTQNIIIFAILLIVPAINLSSMTHSRLRQRVSEIGVRRAFGCKMTGIIMQVITENFMITLVAGMIGFALSVIFAYMFNVNLFARDFSMSEVAPELEIGMLIRLSTLCWTLLFCFILNLLSAGLPAWMASRTNVVNALRGR